MGCNDQDVAGEPMTSPQEKRCPKRCPYKCHSCRNRCKGKDGHSSPFDYRGHFCKNHRRAK